MKWGRGLVLLAALAAPGAAGAETVRNIAIPVKVSDVAMNTFIEYQWERQHWDRFTGTILGCNYTITVPAPAVTLTRGRGTLTLAIKVTSGNCGGLFDFSISPTIAIPSGQLSTEKVKMWLIDLNEMIDDLRIPAWARAALRHELGRRWGIPDPDNIDAFPASLVKGLSSPFFDERSVNWYFQNPFAFGWQVEDGFLVLTPSVNIQAGYGPYAAPEFKTRLVLGEDTDWLDVWSTIKARVKTVRVFTIALDPLYHVDPPDRRTVKYQGNPATEWIMLDLGGTRLGFPQIYIVWVLFEIDKTFYVRKYKLATGNLDWFPATSERYN